MNSGWRNNVPELINPVTDVHANIMHIINYIKITQINYARFFNEEIHEILK